LKLPIIICLAVASLGLAGCGEVVDAGNRGVLVSNGRVDQKSYPEGFYWLNPFTDTMNEVSARNKNYSDEVQSTTKDLQILTLKFNANFRQNPDRIPFLFQTKGETWAEQLVRPAITSILKNALAGYRAPDVVANQSRIQYQVTDQVRRRLNNVGVILEAFDITGISFSEDYAKAIEAKEVAVQRAQAAINQTAVIREEGNQKVIAAEADARAIKAKSESLAQSPNYVKLEWIKAWDGKMPDTVYCSASTPCITSGN
jgi:regulator of protease activity HflC (stomatin/prohibitin superfamily)